MNVMNKIKKALSLLLVFVLVATLLPMPARAATTGREADTIFFATDRHESSSNLKSLLKALAYEPGLVVLGGDHVNNTNSGKLASITSEIQSVYSGVQTFYTYAAHDKNVSADSSNPYAYARTGEVYEGEDYYVYAVDQDHMQSSSSASSASSNFVNWAESVDDGKVIFVVCHMPIHKRRGDNAGGATWMSALNEAGEDHDIVYLWGHNHTGENTTDKNVYYVARGGSLTPQGGSTGTINFTYMNAGYIKNGYATQAVINDQNVVFTRYSTSGSVQSTNTMTRLFAGHTHSYTLTGSVSATCGTAGYRTYACACGDSYTETIAATGDHSYTSVTTDATCGTAGSVAYTCTDCGHSYTESLPATGNHSYTTETVDATCTQNGSVTYTCTACGYSYVETFAASGHAYSAAVTAPTCTEGGYTTYTCTVCGDSYTGDETAARGHDYETVTVTATCTQDGSVTYTCACGDTYTEVIEATGEHVYTAVTVDATCSEEGSVTYTCGCGESYTEVIPATGEHSYVDVITEPSCMGPGYTTHTCTVCADSYIDTYIAPLEHTYTISTIDATCETEGEINYTCVCGDAYGEIIPALGHNYTSEAVDGYLVHTCTRCGDSYSELLEMEITYDKATKFLSGNSYVITLYSGGKYYALSHAGNSLSAVQVIVSNNQITSAVTEDLLWDYSGSKLFYESDGSTYYLYSSTSSTSWIDIFWGRNVTLGVSTSEYSSVSISSNKMKVGSYYLRYSSGAIKADRSAGTTYIYMQNEE